jgi:hypothetical protein
MTFRLADGNEPMPREVRAQSKPPQGFRHVRFAWSPASASRNQSRDELAALAARLSRLAPSRVDRD